MSAESPEKTVLKFLQSKQWSNASVEEIAAGLTCAHNESNLKLNPWHYELKDGRLYDPRLKSFVSGSGWIDSQEEDITGQLEKWFLEKDSGIAVWISPRRSPEYNHPGYPEESITLYRIGYEFNPKTFETKKVLFLTSHQFEHTFKNPHEIRRFIFTEKDSEEAIFDILNYLERISSKKIERELVHDPEIQKKAAKYAYMHLSGVPQYTIINQMNLDGFLGNNSIGCPSLGTNLSGGFGYTETTTLSPSYEGGAKYVRNCGACGATINAFISSGYTCSSCGGTYLGC